MSNCDVKQILKDYQLSFIFWLTDCKLCSFYITDYYRFFLFCFSGSNCFPPTPTVFYQMYHTSSICALLLSAHMTCTKGKENSPTLSQREDECSQLHFDALNCVYISHLNICCCCCQVITPKHHVSFYGCLDCVISQPKFTLQGSSLIQ